MAINMFTKVRINNSLSSDLKTRFNRNLKKYFVFDFLIVLFAILN